MTGEKGSIRLTAAQALVRWMAAQQVEVEGAQLPYFAGVWAIFGHGNAAALGRALAEAADSLPTWRAHSEQGMAHAAIAFAKAMRRRRAMACTSSIGPGATNMITAAAVAHANRLPVLFLPGDVFASRRPDPVLQQIESFADATVSANDCFRPVSRLFDRITRPEQLLDALPRAMAVLTDPAACGPVTLALCQDVQAEAIDWPARFFHPRVWMPRRPAPDAGELAALVAALKGARAPLVVAGGGVLYAGAEAALAQLAAQTGLPVVETQAGKGALPASQSEALGAVGVTGTDAANQAAAAADVIVAVGTRLQDFTTGSRTLFAAQAQLFQVNVGLHDVAKHDARPVLADAGIVLEALVQALQGWRVPAAWQASNLARRQAWMEVATQLLTPPPTQDDGLPSDVQVIGAVQRAAGHAVVVTAAGGMPGELHKFWQSAGAGHYHAEYGFSCMGYEIAGGLGVKLAMPERDIVVIVGDGSYLMLNSELASAAAMGLAITVVLIDNRGFGCIHRLQEQTGAPSFNTLLAPTAPAIDFAAHARSLGAAAIQVETISALEAALRAPAPVDRPRVLVVRVDPGASSGVGGHWWDVPAPPSHDSTDQTGERR